MHAAQIVQRPGIVFRRRLLQQGQRRSQGALDALSGEIKQGEIVHRAGAAGVGGLFIPLRGKRRVLLHALAVLVAPGEPVHGLNMALCGGGLVENGRRAVGLADALAAGLDDARQAELRARVAALGGPAIPAGGLAQGLARPFRAGFIGFRHADHGLRVAALGQLEQLDEAQRVQINGPVFLLPGFRVRPGLLPDDLGGAGLRRRGGQSGGQRHADKRRRSLPADESAGHECSPE